nr:NIb [Freesia mosaic virus]
ADGSRFDSSLTPFLINAVIRLRLEMMERWDLGWEMLQKFYTEIIYTPILTPDGTIVKKFKGNNSGQPSTVVDNTLMVILAMHYSMEKQGWKRNESKERLVFFANGDDLIIAVKPGYEGILDSLAVSFKELGLIYDFSERCHDRQELWFMSHQGHLIDGMYIPKLERERIVSILEWDRSHAIEHRAEAICAAMIEAWGYPDLLLEIRKFYAWILDHDMFHDLAAIGKLPYIAETALRKLYTDRDCEDEELLHYLRAFNFEGELVGTDEVRYQGKSMCRGLRNYNPVASCICKLVNDSDGIVTTIFGLGYGPVIITNGHLFNRNNGTLQINTHHGVFRVENTTKLQIHHVERKDMVLIRMPTDFPPFPQRLKFRSPVQGEKANLIGSLFQQKNISSVVSETTLVMPANNSGYWRHWVSTKDGDCGLPMVSTSDGYILGFHGLTSTISDRNYFVPFTDNFEEDVLRKIGDLNWKRHWKHSADLIAWDGIKLIEEQPQKIFKTTKLISRSSRANTRRGYVS